MNKWAEIEYKSKYPPGTKICKRCLHTYKKGNKCPKCGSERTL